MLSIDTALRDEEIAAKQQRISTFLNEHKLHALLLERHENIAWATAGQVEARIANSAETAPAALLITRDGGQYYIAPNNEGPRLASEEFAGLSYEAALYPWQQNRVAEIVQEITHGGPVASDSPRPGIQHLNLAPLRAPLFAGEVARLQQLGAKTAEITALVLEELRPGITELEMAALTSAALLEDGIFPSVLLMATDDRIHKYKHAVPRNGRLEKYGMLNLCARKWGLVVSITRFIHFDALPTGLAESFQSAAQIHSELLHATRKGATGAEIYRVAERAYREAGVPEELDLHHQGGACGYSEREWIIAPGSKDVVTDPQAFAYNPSLRGAKAEDTVVLRDGAIEFVTATPRLPVIETEVGGTVYRSAGVLVL